MKVLFCTNDQAFQPSNEPYGFFLSMQSLGHEVEIFYYRRKSFFYRNFRKRWIHRMNHRLSEKAIHEGFDLVFVHRGGFVSADTLDKIKRNSKCRSVCFFPDNPFGSTTPPLPFEVIGNYDLFVTKDTYFEEELRLYGFVNVTALPHAYHPSEFEAEITEEELEPFRADVSFIGGHYKFREKFFSKLTDEGVICKIWGPGWINARDPWIRDRVMTGRALDREGKIKALRASKILINLQHGGGSIFWPDDKMFQYVGGGALMMANHKRDIDRLFKIGEEIITYRTRGELQDYIRFYLANEKERLAIAQRGQERARRDHTTVTRFNQIVGLLRERGLLPGNHTSPDSFPTA